MLGVTTTNPQECAPCPTETQTYTSFNTNLNCRYYILPTACRASTITRTLPASCQGALETSVSLVKQTACFPAKLICPKLTTTTTYKACPTGPFASCTGCPTTTITSYDYPTASATDCVTIIVGKREIYDRRLNKRIPCSQTATTTEYVPSTCPTTRVYKTVYTSINGCPPQSINFNDCFTSTVTKQGACSGSVTSR